MKVAAKRQVEKRQTKGRIVTKRRSGLTPSSPFSVGFEETCRRKLCAWLAEGGGEYSSGSGWLELVDGGGSSSVEHRRSPSLVGESPIVVTNSSLLVVVMSRLSFAFFALSSSILLVNGASSSL